MDLNENDQALADYKRAIRILPGFALAGGPPAPILNEAEMLGLRERLDAAALWGMPAFMIWVAYETVALHVRDWLGLEPRNAAHMFYFNFTFAFPAMFAASAFAIRAVYLWVRGLRRLRQSGVNATPWEIVTVVPAIPILLLDMRVVLRTLLILWMSRSWSHQT